MSELKIMLAFPQLMGFMLCWWIDTINEHRFWSNVLAHFTNAFLSVKLYVNTALWGSFISDRAICKKILQKHCGYRLVKSLLNGLPLLRRSMTGQRNRHCTDLGQQLRRPCFLWSPLCPLTESEIWLT